MKYYISKTPTNKAYFEPAVSLRNPNPQSNYDKFFILFYISNFYIVYPNGTVAVRETQMQTQGQHRPKTNST